MPRLHPACVQFIGGTERNVCDRQRQRIRCAGRCRLFCLHARVGPICQHRKPAHAWQKVLEEMHTLLRKVQRHERASGEIAPRPRQALCEVELYRIAADGEQHSSSGRFAHGPDCRPGWKRSGLPGFASARAARLLLDHPASFLTGDLRQNGSVARIRKHYYQCVGLLTDLSSVLRAKL
jgi:hypothetical protein